MKNPYNKNILIIDDKIVDVEKIICPYFEDRGYNIDKESNPNNVKRLITECKHKHSIVFIDFKYDFEDLNGIDLCKIIRKESPLSTLVLCTGFEKLPAEMTAMGVYFDGHYEKEKRGLQFSQKDEYMEVCLNNAFAAMNERVPYLSGIPYDKSLSKYFDKLELLELAYGEDEEFSDIHEWYEKHCGPFNLWTEDITIEKIKEIAVRKEKNKVVASPKNITESKAKKIEEDLKVKIKISRSSFLQYFQIEDSINKQLCKNALLIRHLLYKNPTKWQLSRENFPPLRDLINYFGIKHMG